MNSTDQNQSGGAVNAPAVRQQTAAQIVRSLVESDGYKKRFEEVLGARAPQYLASVANAANSPALRNCDPKSILAAAFVAATLDLPIDRNLGFAHIVPYKGAASFQMGYKGFVQLALRTGQYRNINDAVIPEGVLVSYDELSGDLQLDWKKKRSDKPMGYAAFFRLLNGFEKTVYWSREKVEAHARRYSQSFGNANSPWKSHFDEMAIKTVIKSMLGKYGILSVELQKALAHDQGAQKDIGEEVDYVDLACVNEDTAGAAGPAGGILAASAAKGDTAKTAAPEELPEWTPEKRQVLINDMQTAMLDGNVTEQRMWQYAKDGKHVPEGVDELWALPTDVLAKLKHAIAALKGGRK